MTDSEALTEARVREIMDACKGASPGPWDSFPGSLVRSIDGDVAIPIFEARAPWKKHRRTSTVFKQEWHNTELVRRLDPDTVRALCTLALSALGAAPAGPVAWMGYWPGAGSVNSETFTTHRKHEMEQWRENGAEITPLVPASTIERLSAIEQWSLCKDGVPAAITLMVARFDHELGEWIVGVTESYMIGKEPKSIPAWTHWRYLPNMPEAPDGH